jgi:hypothetical protein
LLFHLLRDVEVAVIWHPQLINAVCKEANLALAVISIIVAAELCAVPVRASSRWSSVVQ